jgi:hypothetical protein
MSLLFVLSLGCGDEPEACTELTFFLDADGDGHGGETSVQACEAPAGHVAQSTDCDDSDASANPDADEVCDGVDNDCNGDIDTSPVDGVVMFADLDEDGFGDAAVSEGVCAGTAGWVEDDTDCDDGDAFSHPGGDEVCDGADNDCDGTTDGTLYPGDFANLAQAVDSLSDGDMLCIEAGDYDESVWLTQKTLHIGGFGSDVTRLNGHAIGYPALKLDNAPETTVRGLSVKGAQVGDSDGVVLTDLDVSGTECTAGNCMGSAFLLFRSDSTLNEVDIVGNTQSSVGTASVYFNGLAWMQDSTVTWNGGRFAENVSEGISTTSSVNTHGLLGMAGLVLTAEGVSFEDNVVHVESTLTTTNIASVNAYGLLYGYSSVIEFTDVDMVDNAMTCIGVGAGNGHAGCNALWRISNEIVWDWTGGTLSGNTVDATSTDAAYVKLGNLSSATIDFADLDIHSNAMTNDTASYSGSCAGFAANTVTRSWTRVDLRDNSADCTKGTFSGWLGNYYGSDTLENLVVAGNTVDVPDGIVYGLIYSNRANFSLVNSVIHGNDLGGYSGITGGFWISSAPSTWVNVAFTENTLTVDEFGTSYPASSVAWTDGIWPDAHHLATNGNSTTSGSVGWDVNAEWNPLSGTGNVTGDPAYTDVSGDDPLAWDFTLGSGSSLIDAGDPTIEDTDGSTSDIGAFGGPESF